VVGVGRDKPTLIVRGMVKPMGRKVVSQELKHGGEGHEFLCSRGQMIRGMSVVVVNGIVVV
jgi:hypothetical protein